MKPIEFPPLRLILTNDCNGHCDFCHQEGSDVNQNMPISLVEECAHAAYTLNLPSIALTGGEPTIRNDLPQIIEVIQKIAFNTKVNLTTNGHSLEKLLHHIHKPIHCINLSLSSLNPSIAELYQNVNPYSALDTLKIFPAENKNINIVITEKNYTGFHEVLQYSIQNHISLDIMFELKAYSDADLKVQKHILKVIESLGPCYIEMKSTPKIVIPVDDSCTINIKHPYLSSLPYVGICKNCKLKGECFERVCAVRVYPDGAVSPCLNNALVATQGTMFEKIDNIYREIEREYSFLMFLVEK